MLQKEYRLLVLFIVCLNVSSIVGSNELQERQKLKFASLITNTQNRIKHIRSAYSLAYNQPRKNRVEATAYVVQKLMDTHGYDKREAGMMANLSMFAVDLSEKTDKNMEQKVTEYANTLTVKQKLALMRSTPKIQQLSDELTVYSYNNMIHFLMQLSHWSRNRYSMY